MHPEGIFDGIKIKQIFFFLGGGGGLQLHLEVGNLHRGGEVK